MSIINNEQATQLDIDEIMLDAFLGYKYRKNYSFLYSTDSKTPKELIKLYYSGEIERKDFDSLKRSFINRYIKNESALEEVHNKDEVNGIAVMYEDMHAISKDEFELFSLLTLHRDLYSKCPFPEAGGVIRQIPVYLPTTGTDTCDPSMIFDELIKIDDEGIVQNLLEIASTMRKTSDYSNIFDFVTEVVKLKCRLIKIHPFNDGNGRTVRCFINKILEEAGIPPVYIKLNERTEYHKAMNLANNEGDYTSITNFYLYKICDSIIELDINERVKEERAARKNEAEGPAKSDSQKVKSYKPSYLSKKFKKKNN